MFVITGGGSGIGRALAHALASRGEKVLIVGRRLAQLRETAQTSPLIEYCCADVSTESGRDCLFAALQGVPSIKALVNNAGTLEPIKPLRELALAEWQRTYAVNVEAALILPQALYAQLEGGRVLNIGSGAAYFPIEGWAAYCSSKAALAMLTRCWQLESDSLAFASVMPGIADTDMQALARQGEHMAPEKVQFYRQLKEEGRLVAVETLALFLCWLLLEVDSATYPSQEWDIYDTSHHPHWLVPPHQVPHWAS